MLAHFLPHETLVEKMRYFKRLILILMDNVQDRVGRLKLTPINRNIF